MHTNVYIYAIHDWIWENPGSIKMEILLYIHVRTCTRIYVFIHVASIMSVYTAKYEHLQYYCTVSELQHFVNYHYIEGGKIVCAHIQNSDFQRSSDIRIYMY